jgi:DNA invertase Pin-like site-specific DNA recombinase
MADLERWQKVNPDVEVREYRDKATGKTMDRPGWVRLWSDVQSGKVSNIVAWRLDRLGRTAAGLTNLLEALQQRQVGLVSLRDSLDLSTPSGRLMSNVLASVAAYETEVRSERIRAGIDAAKAEDKVWGGRREGARNRTTAEKAAAVRKLHAAGETVTAIARATGLSRPSPGSESGFSILPLNVSGSILPARRGFWCDSTRKAGGGPESRRREFGSVVDVSLWPARTSKPRPRPIGRVQVSIFHEGT